MKKYLIRLIGSLCILGALAILLMTTWVQVEGIKNRDLKNIRNQLTADLELAQEKMLCYSEMEMFEEDLKEYGLPRTPSKIKGRFKETENLVKELLNTDVSFYEVLWVAKEAPAYIADTQDLLEIPALADSLIQTGEDADFEITPESLEDTMDSVSGFKVIFVLVFAFFIFLMALALAAAVTHMLNKVRWIKYIFLVFLVLFVVGVCVGVPMAADIIHDEVYMPPEFADLSLRVTIMPYLAAALMLVPIVLDIIFERKFKKIQAQ